MNIPPPRSARSGSDPSRLIREKWEDAKRLDALTALWIAATAADGERDGSNSEEPLVRLGAAS